MHRLLRRQMRKHLSVEDGVPAPPKAFIAAVDAAYADFDSEHKMLERSLELSSKELVAKEAQLRLALDNMPGGMTLEDRDRNYVLINSQYSELHDYPEGFLKVGMSARDEARFQAERGDFGPGDKDDLIEEVAAIYRRGEAVSYERAIAGSGRTLHFNVAPTPEGGYVTIATDITERKRMEEAIRESERRLMSILQESPIGVSLIGVADNRIKFANDRFHAMYGVSEAEALSGTAPQLYAKSGDRQVLIQRFEDEGSVRDAEVRFKRGDGSEFWGLVTVLPFEYEGEPARLVWTYDITDRKRAEEALRDSEQLLATILDHMPAPVYLRDTDGRFMLINRRYEEVHRVTRDDVRGKTLQEVFSKERADDYGALDSETVKQRGVLEGEETHLLWDGEHTLAVVRFPVFDAFGEVVAVGGVDVDITERKRAEEELAEKEAQLRVALDNMPGGMALFDRDLNFVLFNSQNTELLEYPDGLV
ncbi:MAG: PAS domain S-box protein, partial [Proteobacteria bacterium]|nr:PAS domain S-box protein [Pseudomonadota bacterium]